MLTATFNSYGNRPVSTPPHKINTPEPINNKNGVFDHIREGTPVPNLVGIHPLGASGQVGEI